MYRLIRLCDFGVLLVVFPRRQSENFEVLFLWKKNKCDGDETAGVSFCLVVSSSVFPLPHTLALALTVSVADASCVSLDPFFPKESGFSLIHCCSSIVYLQAQDPCYLQDCNGW